MRTRLAKGGALRLAEAGGLHVTNPGEAKAALCNLENDRKRSATDGLRSERLVYRSTLEAIAAGRVTDPVATAAAVLEN